MNILAGGKWLAGFPDYHRAPGQVRVQVLAWRNLARVEGMYFVRPRSVRLLVNYLFEFGPRGVFRKVRSRLGETMRNEKYVSAGIGRVLETDAGGLPPLGTSPAAVPPDEMPPGPVPAGELSRAHSTTGEASSLRAQRSNLSSLSTGSPASGAPRLAPGDLVAFFAPSHPACVERLSLPADLVEPYDGSPPPAMQHILYKPATDPAPEPPHFWEFLAGFSEHSGVALDAQALRQARGELVRFLKSTDWTGARDLPVTAPSEASEVSEILAGQPATATAVPDGADRAAPCLPGSDASSPGSAAASRRPRPRGTVFGYGNYAKSFLIPNASPFIEITTIHEVDPTQIPREDRRYRWDTAPLPRTGERADVFFGSGYHHTHVPVALGALSQGAYAVIEKPVAVDEEQLVALLAALQRSGPKLFSCYHKRYIPFNALAREDLGLKPGDPVSYSCQVYEVPLPPRHWYHWPNAKSRLVSNGCHWIDHFLFLNGYPEVSSFDLVIAPDETLNVSVTAANGAFFTMVLTDQGSERVGLRDHIELRTKRSTVRMTDGANYLAEGPDRILRQATINKLFSYQNMYQTIARKIAAGEPGDPIDSVRISAGLVLDLERLFQRKRGAKGAAQGAAQGA